MTAVATATPGDRVSEASRSRVSWRAAGWPMVVAGITAVTTGYVALHDPNGPAAHLPVCPLHAATGLWCPGCGGTRAAYDLAHGDVVGALSMNPLFTLAVPILAVVWTRWLLRGQGVRLKAWRFRSWGGYVLGIVLLAFTILRNTPAFGPYLAP